MSKRYITARCFLAAAIFCLMLVAPLSAKITSQKSSFTKVFLQRLTSTIEKKWSNELAPKTTTEASFSAMVLPCPGGTDVLGGNVFGDFNYNGANDQTSPLPNTKVYLFECDANGASVIADSTTTDENGDYFFSGLPSGDSYRVEFFLAPYLQELKQYTEGFAGIDNGTLVQMATVPSCAVNAAYAFNMDYYEPIPNMVSTCFVNGNNIPQTPPADPADNPALDKTVILFNWNNANSAPEPAELANAGETGSVYGLAYNRFDQQIYTSAFIKRHVGLGPQAIGGIYKIDATDVNNPVVSNFIDVESIGVDVGSIGDNVARGLPDEVSQPSNDPTAYTKVATESIGGLAINELTNTLYFINLFDKKLYALDVSNGTPTAADVTSYDAPTSPCSNGEWRPFAVSVHRGEVYIGGVCDAASGTEVDLDAYIYRLDGTTFTPLFSFDLDYTKGYAANENNCDDFPGWYPWTDEIPASCSGSGFETVTYPQPILSDIQFDIDGSMILGFMDRMGHQLGYKNYPLTGILPLLSAVSGGDILRAYNNAGTWEIESNGTAGPLTSAGADNGQGNDGGEFYYQDLFAGPSDNIPFPPHVETTQGALALFPGSGEVATTSLDPYSTLFNSGGINWMNNTDGSVRHPGYVLYRSSTSNISTFSKGNGLGGLIALGALAPMEAGGTVWQDTNSDGIQDACESPMSGVNVSLYDGAGTLVATHMTGTNGMYAFNTDLAQNTTYYIVFGTGGQYDTSDGSLNNNSYLSVGNTGMWLNPDQNDSDAISAPTGTAGGAFDGLPFITLNTGGEGFVTHNMDAGFTPDNLNPIAGIGGAVFNDLDGDGIQDGGLESGIEGVTVSLLDSDGTAILMVTTDANGDYYFPNLPAGDYTLDFDFTTNTDGLIYDISPQNQGNDDAIDSDVNPATEQTSTISFDPANGNLDIDAGGVAPSGSISGLVFNDDNENGIQDDADGIEGVTVILYDSNDNIVENTTTDSDGNYLFSGVDAGNYYVVFNPTTNTSGLANPNGSPQDVGNDDTLDSDPNSSTGAIATFSFDPQVNATATIDAGFYEPTNSLCGHVFEDINNNGIQDANEGGIAGVTVVLLDDNGAEVATFSTNADGNYCFNNLVAGEYSLSFDPDTNTNGLSDYTPSPQDQGNDDSLDSDISPAGLFPPFSFDPLSPIVVDAGFTQPSAAITGLAFNDLDEDGIQDSGEPIVSNVQVSLYGSNNNLIATVMTGNDGTYSFSGVQSGDYYIVFNPATTGAIDFDFSPQNAGNNDAIDSDPNANGTTMTISINAAQGGANNVNVGLIFATAAIGDFVWKDCDKNGIQDAGEAGLAGVPISLSGNDIGGNPVALTTTTDINGAYLFSALNPGVYTITFGYPTSPAGLALTPQNVGNNSAIDSDAHPNTGETNVFAIAAGEMLTNIDAGYQDVTAPTFDNPPANETVDCDDPNFGTIPTNLTASDNCDTDVTVTFVGESNTPIGGGNGACAGFVIERTWAASDDCGNATLYTQSLTATDNTPPTITPTDPLLQGVMSGDTILFQCGATMPLLGVDAVTATDICDDDVEVIFTDLLIGEGDCAEDGYLLLIYCSWTAADDCGNETIYEVYMMVSDTEAPMFVGAIPLDLTINCDDPIPPAAILTATDNCVQDVQVEFEEATLGELCEDGKILRKWTAIDSCGNMTMINQSIFIVTPDLEIVGVPNDITVDCGNIPASTLEPTLSHDCYNPEMTMDEVIVGDTCMDYKIIRKWIAMNECGQMDMEQYTVFVLVSDFEFVNIPTDITVECDEIPVLPTVATTPDCFEVTIDQSEVLNGNICSAYTINRTWTATNSCGETITATQVITVNVDDLALTGIPNDVTVECENIPNAANPQPTSDCYEVDINFNQTIIGEICENYEILRVWTATDDCGNQVMYSQMISVQVDELALTGIPNDLTISCETEVPDPVTPQATSDCYEVDINFQETIEQADCSEEVKITRIWTASDECGNLAIYNQMITIIDTLAPVITIVHPDLVGVEDGDTLYLQCTEVINLENAVVTVEDNCDDDDIEIEFVEDVMVGDCDEDGYIVKMTCCWLAMDECGNSAEWCVTILFMDTQNPVLVGVPADMTVELPLGQSVPDVPIVTATDNCSDVEVIFMETQEANDCGYNITRTWMAEDACGNTTMQTQLIIVNDICDCPDIICESETVSNASCGATNGSIVVETELAPAIYEWILLPPFGDSNADGNVITNLPPGSYLLIINLPNIDDCDKKIYFDILQDGCADTLNVTIDSQEPYCIDESVLDYEGTISSAEFCSTGNPLTVTANELDDRCLTLTPALGYQGTSPDLICVIHCFDGSTVDCDTTYLSVTVEPLALSCELQLANVSLVPATCGAATGSISFEVTGAVGDLVYNWSNSATSNINSGLIPGTYSLQVFDPMTNCTLEETFVIENTTDSSITLADVGIENVTCPQGDDGAITAENGAIYNVYAGGNALGQTPQTGLSAGIYLVQKADGTCVSEIEVTITAPNDWSVDTALTNESCDENDGVINLSVSGANGFYTYFWSPNVSDAAVAGGLADGTYSTTIMDANGCTQILETILGNDCDDCLFSYEITTENASCAGENNGSITINTNATLTYNWSDTNLSGNTVTNLTAGTYGVTITDGICTEMESITIVEPTILAAEPAIMNETCITNDGMIGLTVTGGSGDYSYVWSPNVSTTNIAENLSEGFYNVTITDAEGCEATVMNMLVTDECQTGDCQDFISETNIAANVSDCDALADVCVDIPLAIIGNYSILDNGSPYMNGIDGCNFDTTFIYNYSNLQTQGISGTYNTSWTVNGTASNGTFTTLAELVDFMNTNDASGNWMLNTTDMLLMGGNPDNNYGMLMITQNGTTVEFQLGVNINFIPNGTQFELAVGEHQLVFTDEDSCTDTIQVSIFCIPTSIQEVSIEVAQVSTICPDFTDLPGNPENFGVECNSCDNVELSLGANNCIDYIGVTVGTDVLYVISCDDLGLCDTLILTVNVVEEMLAQGPIANTDFVTTPMNEPVNIEVMRNDEVNGETFDLNIQRNPEQGALLQNLDDTYTYSPAEDYCGNDQFIYYLCNDTDCDTAVVSIKVLCDAPRPFNGFSPNEDNINDAYVIQGLEQFKDNELQIFDRWGALVYRSFDYQNDWKGTWDGADLPDATYFYVLRYDGGKLMTGYVQLQR